jgi:hypothetical protein
MIEYLVTGGNGMVELLVAGYALLAMTAGGL